MLPPADSKRTGLQPLAKRFGIRARTRRATQASAQGTRGTIPIRGRPYVIYLGIVNLLMLGGSPRNRVGWDNLQLRQSLSFPRAGSAVRRMRPFAWGALTGLLPGETVIGLRCNVMRDAGSLARQAIEFLLQDPVGIGDAPMLAQVLEP